VGKVAERAGKAAPAVAIAGALVAAPQAQHLLVGAGKAASASGGAATGAKASTAGQREAAPPAGRPAKGAVDSVHAVTVASHSTARHAARTRNSHYTVRSGDTLSQIAERYYGRANAWQWLYHENEKTIADPNLIYVGEQILLPAIAPAHYAVTDYRPRHAKSSEPASHRGQGSVITQSAHGSAGALSGTLDCAGLEQLWDDAGGNPIYARMAAEIAMAESSGNQYALSPTDDFGYWQINISNGSLATYDAYGNARSAIILSHDGTDWYPWTTYTSGAYAGRC
jgi:LysM repeat protein